MPTTSHPELHGRDNQKTEIVTLTDANSSPTATVTLISTTSSGTPGFAYGIIGGGIAILAILGAFAYFTCYKRRSRAKLPGYQNFGSDAALPGSANGDMRQAKVQG